jgi:Amt family ammonium transporter
MIIIDLVLCKIVTVPYSALKGVIYPIVSHWTWASNGWLKVTPYKDYAGSGVVHITGGVCSLVGAYLMGPRIGRFHTKTGKPYDIRGHSVPVRIFKN